MSAFLAVTQDLALEQAKNADKIISEKKTKIYICISYINN